MAVIERKIRLVGPLGESEIVALFDSGASVSCIRPDIAEPLEQPVSILAPLQISTADKRTVEEEIYEMFRSKFADPYWHQPVSHGIPRWKHEVNWARQDAKKKKGLIKPPNESGRGVWELTAAGMGRKNS